MYLLKLHDKISKWVGIVITIVIALAAVYIGYYCSIEDYVIYPNNEGFTYCLYDDHERGGNSSIIDCSKSDHLISVHFNLGDKFLAPFVGISIHPKDKQPFDVSRYNAMVLKIISKNLHNIIIAPYTRNVNTGSPLSHDEVIYCAILAINSDTVDYKIHYKDLIIPDWWRELNGLRSYQQLPSDWSQMLRINIGNAYIPDLSKTYSLDVVSVKFTRDNTALIIWTFIISLCVIGFSFLIDTLIKKRKKRPLESQTIVYKALPIVESVKPDDFILFIGLHFDDSELTIEWVASETGINSRKITAYLQENYNCNFKTYVNNIRINESKRLLIESTLNISEIAFKVGFNTPTHFNRVFKSELQMSPSEYRETHKV